MISCSTRPSEIRWPTKVRSFSCSALGTHAKVAGLVYITAFTPDRGESVNSRIANLPTGAPVPPILPEDGYLFLDKAKFPHLFAGDVDPKTAAFMADSQVPWGIDALAGAITEPAWKSKPSCYLLVRDDRMIPYLARQFIAKRAGATVVEVPGSHAIYVSNPNAVAEGGRRCEIAVHGSCVPKRPPNPSESQLSGAGGVAGVLAIRLRALFPAGLRRG